MGTSTASTATSDPQSVINGVTYWDQNGGSADAMSILPDGTVRFEVDKGSTWRNDPATVDRSEIASTQQVANGTAVEAAYTLTLQQGAINNDPNGWAVLGQFHQDNNAHPGSPPFSLGLVQGKMCVQIAYTDTSGNDVSKRIWTDSNTVVQGTPYNMDVKATFDPNGNGSLSVTRNGMTLVTYTGPLGYASQSNVYWKEGIYRAASATTMVADFSNTQVTISGGGSSSTAAPMSLMAAAPMSRMAVTRAVYSTITGFDPNSGKMANRFVTYKDGGTVSTTFYSTGVAAQVDIVNTDGTRETDNYGADSSLTKRSVTAADGSRVADYFSGDQTTQHMTYSSAGKMTLQQQFTAGVMTYQAKLNSDGSTLYSQFDTSGTLIRNTTQYVSGYRDVINYGITGQGYTSQKTTFNAANQLVATTSYRSDNSVVSTTSFLGNGARMFKAFDPSGNLTQSVSTATDGSRETFDYLLTNGSYASDHIITNAAGQNTLVQRFSAAGQLTFQLTGSGSSFMVYGSGGTLSQKTVVDPNNIKSIYDYASNGTTVVQQRLFNASGTPTLINRYTTSGVTIFSQSMNSDGSSVQLTYSTAGVLTQQVITKADKSSTVTVFVPGSTKVASITSYTGTGLMAATTINNADGSVEIDKFYTTGPSSVMSSKTITNGSGTITTAITYNADGSLASSKVLGSDGSTTANVYSGTGVLQQSKVTNADGSRDITQYGITTGKYVTTLTHFDPSSTMTHLEQTAADGSKVISDYAITGQSYTSQVVNINAAGQETGTVRYHADKTLAYYDTLAPNGTRTTNLYDAAGNVTQSNAVAADGTQTAKAYAGGLTFTSGSGNDTFTSFHNDVFAFQSQFGHDTVNNFNAGSGAMHDVIQLSQSLAADFSHLTMTQTGADALLSFADGSALTLTHTKVGALTGANFSFV